jgi:hypothetical protein
MAVNHKIMNSANISIFLIKINMQKKVHTLFVFLKKKCIYKNSILDLHISQYD